MLSGPRFVYRLRWHPKLAILPMLVPGAHVQGWLGGRWYYVHKIEVPSDVVHWQIEVAWHSGWRVAEEMVGIPVDSVTPIDVNDNLFVTHDGWLLDYGRRLAEYAAKKGELKEEAVEKLTTYQTRSFALGATRPIGYLRWSPGGGKTAGGLNCIMSRTGDAVVLCPAAARKAWRWRPEGKRGFPTTVEKFTNLETHCVLPESDQPKGYEDLDAYLKRMRSDGRRAVVVVGMESLRDNVNRVKKIGASTLVIDESHLLGSTKRVDGFSDENGDTIWKKSKTAGGEQTMVLSAVELARSPFALRVGMTGTPIDSSVRRLWSQLDILSPGGYGFYSQFRERFCEFKKTIEGYNDDSGASNVEELKRRCAFFFSDVPREVTHAELPPFRMEVVYLASPERIDVPEEERQNRPDAFVDEMRRFARAARGAAGGRGLFREAARAEACSRKRRATQLWAEETVQNGGKVVVLMERKPMVERWAEAFRKAMPGIQGWTATGDDSERERDRIIDAFATWSGPCWLIGTGPSIGTSKDGLQCAQLGVVAQFPEKVGLFLQYLGRFDRLGGVGTIIRIPVSEGTIDDREITQLVRHLGPVEQFTNSPELREMADQLDGIDDPSLTDSIIAKLLA